MVFVTCVAVLAVVNPYISGIIVDNVIKGGEYDLLPKLLICLVSVTLGKSILRWVCLLYTSRCV